MPRCGRQTSATAGTIFQDTRKPLRLWFRAMWHVTSQKDGAGWLGLQRVLGLGSYQTALAWLHKLRRAMVRPGRERLGGVVEAGETYWGGPEEGVADRQTERKALIAVAVEEPVEPGAVIHSGGWRGYEPLVKKGYRHRIVFLWGRRKQASELLPQAHKAISLLKRWMLARTKGRSATSIWTTTSTNSCSASTAAAHAAAASSSTGSSSKPLRSSRRRTAPSWPIGTPNRVEPHHKMLGLPE